MTRQRAVTYVRSSPHSDMTEAELIAEACKIELQIVDLRQRANDLRREAEVRARQALMVGFVEPDFESVPCPTCGAGIGQECRTRTGNRSGSHRDRWVPVYEQAEADWIAARRG